MDLLDKAKKIIMTSLLVLYSTNPVPLMICALAPLGELKQQRLDAKEELQEEHTFVLTRRKKKGKKTTCRVVIKEVNTKRSSGNLLILRSFQSRVARKRRMVDEK
jgi:hypothetical protein